MYMEGVRIASFTGEEYVVRCAGSERCVLCSVQGRGVCCAVYREGCVVQCTGKGCVLCSGQGGVCLFVQCTRVCGILACIGAHIGGRSMSL